MFLVKSISQSVRHRSVCLLSYHKIDFNKPAEIPATQKLSCTSVPFHKQSIAAAENGIIESEIILCAFISVQLNNRCFRHCKRKLKN